jgi:hypothetical protein
MVELAKTNGVLQQDPSSYMTIEKNDNKNKIKCSIYLK